MALASPERLHRDLVELLHRGAGARDFSLTAIRILARTVPFDGVRPRSRPRHAAESQSLPISTDDVTVVS
jgi:hypothetical protein